MIEFWRCCHCKIDTDYLQIHCRSCSHEACRKCATLKQNKCSDSTILSHRSWSRSTCHQNIEQSWDLHCNGACNPSNHNQKNIKLSIPNILENQDLPTDPHRTGNEPTYRDPLSTATLPAGTLQNQKDYWGCCVCGRTNYAPTSHCSNVATAFAKVATRKSCMHRTCSLLPICRNA